MGAAYGIYRTKGQRGRWRWWVKQPQVEHSGWTRTRRGAERMVRIHLRLGALARGAQ